MTLCDRNVLPALVTCSLIGGGVADASAVTLSFLGRYSTGQYDQSACETVAFDPVTKRAFTSNSGTKRVDVIGMTNPMAPGPVFSIALGVPYDAAPNHVAFRNGVLAVACIADAGGRVRGSRGAGVAVGQQRG